MNLCCFEPPFFLATGWLVCSLPASRAAYRNHSSKLLFSTSPSLCCLSLVRLRRESDRAALGGTWNLARVNPPQCEILLGLIFGFHSIYFESFFYFENWRVVAPATCGQLCVGYQNMCTAGFLSLFTSASLFQACKRSLLGQVPRVKLLYVFQMTCRDASVGSGAGKG